MMLHVDEVGTRLRHVARDWGVPGWDTATPSQLRARIAEAYQRELDAEMRRRAVEAARLRARVGAGGRPSAPRKGEPPNG